MAFKNTGQFFLDLDRFKDRVPEDFVKLHKALAFELLRRIVMRTPVGNPSLWKYPPPPGYVGGRARGNWQVSLMGPTEGETGRIDPSGGPTTGIGVTIIGGLPPYAAVWIYNNVPYILKLEHGYSRQAPAGMVAISLVEVNTSLAV